MFLFFLLSIAASLVGTSNGIPVQTYCPPTLSPICYIFDDTNTKCDNTHCKMNHCALLASIHSAYEDYVIRTWMDSLGEKAWLGLRGQSPTWMDGSELIYYNGPNDFDASQCAVMDDDASYTTWREKNAQNSENNLCKIIGLPCSAPPAIAGAIDNTVTLPASYPNFYHCFPHNTVVRDTCPSGQYISGLPGYQHVDFICNNGTWVLQTAVNYTVDQLSCGVDGNWSVWSEWSACDVTCGSGQKSRVRSCDNPAPVAYGAPCVGEEIEHKNCSIYPDPCTGAGFGVWELWSQWTECSERCGSGQRNRSRTCGQTPCLGEGTEIGQCSGCYCPNWEMWYMEGNKHDRQHMAPQYYERTTESINNRPIFIKRPTNSYNGRKYLYHTGLGWMIGSNPSSGYGGLYLSSTANDVNDLRGTWEWYNSNQDIWVYDDSFRLVCIPENHCIKPPYASYNAYSSASDTQIAYVVNETITFTCWSGYSLPNGDNQTTVVCDHQLYWNMTGVQCLPDEDDSIDSVTSQSSSSSEFYFSSIDGSVNVSPSSHQPSARTSLVTKDTIFSFTSTETESINGTLHTVSSDHTVSQFILESATTENIFSIATSMTEQSIVVESISIQLNQNSTIVGTYSNVAAVTSITASSPNVSTDNQTIASEDLGTTERTMCQECASQPPLREGECPAILIPNGTPDSSARHVGAVVTVRCARYFMFGDRNRSMTVTCQNSSTWQPRVQRCQEIIDCGDTLNVENALPESHNVTVAAKLRYICQNNLTFPDGSNHRSTTCTADGTWFPVLSGCSEPIPALTRKRRGDRGPPLEAAGAEVMGSFGMLILIGIAGGIILLDLATLGKQLAKMKRNLRSFLRLKKRPHSHLYNK